MTRTSVQARLTPFVGPEQRVSERVPRDRATVTASPVGRDEARKTARSSHAAERDGVGYNHPKIAPHLRPTPDYR